MESSSGARERVLATAERLFAQRGFTSVTLRDIAAEVGIRHTSLYHHAPGGKEELFVEVTRRACERHRAGLVASMENAGSDLRQQLYAVADWLLSQPPMDLIRIVHSDMPAVAPEAAQELSYLVYRSLLVPIRERLDAAHRDGTIDHDNPGLVAGGLLGMLESLHAVPEEELVISRAAMAHNLIDVVLDGLRPRPACGEPPETLSPNG